MGTTTKISLSTDSEGFISQEGSIPCSFVEPRAPPPAERWRGQAEKTVGRGVIGKPRPEVHGRA